MRPQITLKLFPFVLLIATMAGFGIVLVMALWKQSVAAAPLAPPARAVPVRKAAEVSLPAPPSGVQGGLLLSFDFNGAANPWPGMSVSAALQPEGTIDVADTATRSGALLSPSGAIESGLLPVRNTETNLGKLTLSFDHSVSAVQPVTVQIESYDKNKKRTGGREGIVYPAAPDFYLRAALELSTLKPFGGGTFKPTDPFVKIMFRANNTDLKIDNVAYASPAFYVSAKGSDSSDGRTEATAFADPQKAISAAQPGDIILLREGVYTRAASSSVHEGIVAFRRAGTPAAWISLKNYPGETPTLKSDAWNAIKIGRGSRAEPSRAPALAYLEVRGLHIRGNADIVEKEHKDLIDKVDPLTNGNGISGSGGDEINLPHHLRFADNLVEYCSGGGIGAGNCDWVTIENNVIRNNSWWVIYATSGVSLLGTRNFDAADNIYKSVIRDNRVSGNRCFRKWKKIGKISDGNGIIVDSNYVPAKNQVYLGRTLVQNNLSVGNGGSGIHAYKSHRVDIINNTAYHNGASPELNWGQIFVQVGDDMTVRNNILVSRPNQPINSVGSDGGDQNSTKVVRSHNLYFGGLAPRLTGEGDLIADPQFVRPRENFEKADFQVGLGSGALRSGGRGPLVPLRGLNGVPRPFDTPPDRGAFQR